MFETECLFLKSSEVFVIKCSREAKDVNSNESKTVSDIRTEAFFKRPIRSGALLLQQSRCSEAGPLPKERHLAVG